MPKIAIVVTSAAKMGDHETGLWLEEAAAPYKYFVENGAGADIISISGGDVPLDKASLGGDFNTAECKWFMETNEGKLKGTASIKDTDFSQYDAVYLAGGHGTCADYINNADLTAVIDSAYAKGKVVSACCHGVLGFVDAKKPDGSALVKDLKVCGFTNSEEAAVGLTEKVPFLLETELKKKGANFEGGADWGSHVQVDGKVVTGQNPASSTECAKQILALC